MMGRKRKDHPGATAGELTKAYTWKYSTYHWIVQREKEKQQYTAKRKAFSSNARIAHMTSKVAFSLSDLLPSKTKVSAG